MFADALYPTDSVSASRFGVHDIVLTICYTLQKILTIEVYSRTSLI